MTATSNVPGRLRNSGPQAKPPEHITHTGRIVTLIPLAPSHADDLFEIVGSERNTSLWDYLPFGPFPEPEKFRQIIERQSTRQSNSADRIFFTIVDNGTGRKLGIIALVAIRPGERSIEIGPVVLSKALQRTPGATEAMYLLSKHVFEDLGYRRYEWRTDTLNAASCRAAERLGFVPEGVLRSLYILKDRPSDVAFYSILENEWPRCGQAMEQWLAPANFDADGRQKKSLAGFRES